MDKSMDLPRNQVRMASPGGFTLIELIVVMALIAIMLAFAAPRLQGDLFGEPSKKLARQLLANVTALKTRAVRDQKVYRLVIDLNKNQFYVVHDEMDEETLEKAVASARKFPHGIRVREVMIHGMEEIRSGQAEIGFYPKGYSDKVLIHMEDNDDGRIAYLIEPFLAGIKILEDGSGG
jgi:prepilin-type N-terminal cleavage/methylation domain-containing protein